jgi:hypothetical protein
MSSAAFYFDAKHKSTPVQHSKRRASHSFGVPMSHIVVDRTGRTFLPVWQDLGKINYNKRF